MTQSCRSTIRNSTCYNIAQLAVRVSSPPETRSAILRPTVPNPMAQNGDTDSLGERAATKRVNGYELSEEFAVDDSKLYLLVRES